MPLYFFHCTERGRSIPDLEGVELQDLAAAERAAIEGASSIVAEAVKGGDRHYQGRFDVQDEMGDVVLTMTLSCPVNIEIVRPETRDR